MNAQVTRLLAAWGDATGFSHHSRHTPPIQKENQALLGLVKPMQKHRFLSLVTSAVAIADQADKVAVPSVADEGRGADKA